MRRVRGRRALPLACAAILAASVTPAVAAPAAERCATPAGLRATPTGPSTAVVTWRLPASQRGAAVRVWRSGRAVGQTRRRTLTVRIPAGRRVSIAVGIVEPARRVPRCRATLVLRPSGARTVRAPRDVRDEAASASSVVIRWGAVPGARAYRVWRDGAVVGQTRARHMLVRVNPGRPAAVSVAAVASGGRLGAAAVLRVHLGEHGPATPADLRLIDATDDSLEVRWQPAAGGSAPVRGYRVLRDGVTVGQTAATSFRLGRLFPNRPYRLQIVAVDSRGRLSAPSLTLSARTAMPPQSLGGVRLFVLASTDASFRAFQRVYQQVSVVHPTYFDCEIGTGAMLGRDDPLVTTWAMARGVAVMPRYNCQHTATVHTLVSSPSRRQALIAELVDLVERHGYQGINLDLEAGAASDRDGFTALVAGLAAALHERGARLSVDVSAKTRDVANHPRSTFYDYVALSAHADEIIVMSWGLHWSTSRPGPLMDLRWFTQVYDYVATLPRPGRFVLAVPGYAFDWANGGGSANPAVALDWEALQSLIARTGAQPVYDPASAEWHFTYTDANGAPHEVWYSDAAGMATRAALAAPRGLAGVALWRAGQEDPAVWGLPGFGPRR